MHRAPDFEDSIRSRRSHRVSRTRERVEPSAAVEHTDVLAPTSAKRDDRMMCIPEQPKMAQPDAPSPARSRLRASAPFTFGPKLSRPSGRNRIDATRIAP